MPTDILAAESTKSSSPPKPLPRVALSTTLKLLMSPSEERVHMRERLQRVYDRHGIASAQNLGIFNMVHLFGPDANRFVLLDKDRIFSARKPWMTIMGRIFPNGLLLMDGDEHKLNRKIMHTAFTRPALRAYAERMNPMIAAGIEEWRGAGSDRRFLVFPAIKELTLAMAASIFVGVELGPETKRMNAAFEDLVAASMSKIRLPIPGLEFQRGLRARKFMVDFFRGMIADKRAGDASDIFARLARTVTDEGESFADQQIVDHMSFLMMAAHDTTTSTLTSMIYELAVHPEWQQRVRDECSTLGDAPLGFDDLERFAVTGRVMKETLRRYPPLPVIPRIAEAETEFAGYRIPKGSMCTVSPIFTHYMPEWWDEPRRFDPDRFAPGRAEDERHSHSYIPFGGGPHMCIGLRFAETQIKLVMHHLVRRYRWSVPEGYEMPVQQAPISKPLDGLPVRLERID
jgi:cytochrome P450